MPKNKNVISKGQGYGLNNPIPTMAQQEASVNKVTAYGLSNTVPTMAQKNKQKAMNRATKDVQPKTTQELARQPRGRGQGVLGNFGENWKRGSVSAYKNRFPLIQDCQKMDVEIANAKKLLESIRSGKSKNFGQAIVKQRNIINLSRWINKMENYVKDLKCGVVVGARPASPMLMNADGTMSEVDMMGFAEPSTTTQMAREPNPMTNTMTWVWVALGGIAVYMIWKKK